MCIHECGYVSIDVLLCDSPYMCGCAYMNVDVYAYMYLLCDSPNMCGCAYMNVDVYATCIYSVTRPICVDVHT